jgi:SAM-dependent methyltransferase
MEVALTDASDWKGQVGEAWADEWRRTDRTLAPVGDALIAAAEASLEGQRAPAIVEIGCGAGTIAFALADRISGARVVGIDLSPALIAVARERGRDCDDVSFEEADASTWQPQDSRRFDAIVSRHGVMFFPDPVAAFSHLRSLCASGARLTFSCFRPRAENPWVLALDPILARFAPEALAAPPPAVGPFAFGNPERVETILTDAGFEAPVFQPFDFDTIVGCGDDPVADAVSYFSRIGPFAGLLRELDGSRRAAAIDELKAVAVAHLVDGAVRLRGAAWIVTARSGA